MHPLPTHTVDLLLHLISPLSDPLPSHLISTSLQQRHHFLQISPSSPVEYLCWPSPDNAKIVHLLDRLTRSSDHASFQTRYTSDSESALAHVQISSDAQGLRMLFHWDGADGWKYHDLRLMPFPSPSYLTPQESLASSSTADTSRLPSTEVDEINDRDDDDSYWDAYGAVGHDLIPSIPQSGIDAVEGEDAYWAQYASVQGSADSTVPSPLPTHRKLRLANTTDDEPAFAFPPQNNPIIYDIPVNAIHSLPHASRQEPPSPNTLAHLLSMISPRKETCSPAFDDPYSLRSPVLTPERTTTESELVTPPLLPNGYLDASNVSPVALKLNGVPLSQCYSRLQAEDTALADSIRGLYFLWKAGRKGELDDKDQSVFLRIVQAAIAHN